MVFAQLVAKRVSLAARTILSDPLAKPKLKDVTAVREEMSYNRGRNAVSFLGMIFPRLRAIST